MKCIHHNDQDGRGSAAIVSIYENNYDNNNFIELDYSKEIPYNKIKKDEKLYIVDFSFTETTLYRLKKLLKITKNIIWCDHHKSTLDLIKNHSNLNKIKGLRKNNISGMGLIYMYLYKLNKLTECPRVIQLISDYDCFVFKYGKDTNYFSLGLDCHEYNPTNKIWIDLFNKDKIKKIINQGKYVYDYIKNDYNDYLNKYSFEGYINDLNCLFINRKANSFIFGDKINDYDIVCSYVFNGDKYMYSLFTNKEYVNCKDIAEHFGGGGHVKSAGFESDKLLIIRGDIND